MLHHVRARYSVSVPAQSELAGCLQECRIDIVKVQLFSVIFVLLPVGLHMPLHFFPGSELVHAFHVQVLVIKDKLLILIVKLIAVPIMHAIETIFVVFVVLTVQLVVVVCDEVRVGILLLQLMLEVLQVLLLATVEVAQRAVGALAAISILAHELLIIIDDVDLVVVNHAAVIIEFVFIFPIENLLLLVLWRLWSRWLLLARAS